MIIFSIYTLITWWAAFRGRRRWSGLAAVVAGTSGMGLVYVVLRALGEHGFLAIPMAEMLLLPYAGLLLVVGLYIVALPRRAETPTCGRCFYDLTDHDPGDACPECGSSGSRIPAGEPIYPWRPRGLRAPCIPAHAHAPATYFNSGLPAPQVALPALTPDASPMPVPEPGPSAVRPDLAHATIPAPL
ncbi:MAG: hypothetical protein HRU70_14495 [Phycisphaeraceae bacterium]|nr:MAG: hypothetical protein HRU70_14495 [Phycisphaeraceae bacterium]